MQNTVITFLGSGDAFGSGGRFQACILIDCAGNRMLLDCGASSLIAMKKFGVDPNSINFILISHLHGDHFGGIPFFILDAQFSNRTIPLTIAGPTGAEARVKKSMEVLFARSSETRRKYKIEYLEVLPGAHCELGSYRIAAVHAIHPTGAPSYAYRIEGNGRIIGYSGDTEWTDDLVKISDGADAFICESFFFEKRAHYHINYKFLLEKRTQLGCKRIILTHLGIEMLQRLTEIQMECAEDGMVIEL